MKLCPVCGIELKQRIVYDVEVDFCPKCGGVWLDGGELQKLIQKIKEYAKYEEEYEEFDNYRPKFEEKHKKKSIFEFIEDIFEIR